MDNNFANLIADTEHWQNCKPPLSPNQEEVRLYKELIGDNSPVCLLGMTKELIHLCDLAVDLKPINIKKPTLQCDWNNLEGSFGAIIGDGVLNLTGLQFIEKALKISKKFICRTFTYKQPGMKYATIFPTEFPGSKVVIQTQ